MNQFANDKISIAYHTRACQGEHYNGDLVYIEEEADFVFFAIIDAAGHGRAAQMITRNIESLLRESESKELVELSQTVHSTLKGGVGAVASFGKIDLKSLVFSFVQIGDTHGKVFGARNHGLFGQEGMFGHAIPTPKIFQETLTSGEIIVLCTDGVSVRFDLQSLRHYRSLPPQKVARWVIEKFGKHHDDATCLIWRCL